MAVGEPADVERVILHHPSLPRLSMAGTPIGDVRADVEYCARWTPRSDPCDPVQRHQMYFTLDDLGGIEGSGAGSAWPRCTERSSAGRWLLGTAIPCSSKIAS